MKKYGLVFSIVMIIAVLSTVAFYFFIPKSLKYITNPVITTEDINKDIPYPADAKELSKSKTDSGAQITLETNKSPEEVQNYYKNVYAVKNWTLADSGKKDGFLYAKFEKSNLIVTVSSSSQGSGGNLDSTVVVIEETKANTN